MTGGYGPTMYTAPGAQRWTARRKLELVEAVDSGRLPREALQQLGVSDEEFAEWLQRYAAGDDKARRRLRAKDMSLRWGGTTRKQRRNAASTHRVQR